MNEDRPLKGESNGKVKEPMPKANTIEQLNYPCYSIGKVPKGREVNITNTEPRKMNSKRS